VKIGLAQLNTHVGAIETNTDKVLVSARQARDELGCDLIVYPELTLSGYPPEDLLLHKGMRKRVIEALEVVRRDIMGITLCLGYPEYEDKNLFNSGIVLRDGQVLANHRKWILPNYAVFDEKRYFEAGTDSTVVELSGIHFALTICEDAWEPEPCHAAADAGAEILLVINGSPYHMHKQSMREAMLGDRAKEIGLPLVYVNMVGGQDELVFDGGSVAIDAKGRTSMRAPAFEEGIYLVEVERRSNDICLREQELAPVLSTEEAVYKALVLGTRDYVNKNGFKSVVLGLSGGIDSALTLCVAVDALGADRVRTVMMPSRYTSKMSLEDSAAQAAKMGVQHDVFPIEPIFESVQSVLTDVFKGLPENTTEENIQARCRGLLLMAVSNKLNCMLLTTGNKSEMAVGYATLYGDMAGGFAPLKDCSKSLVYMLAGYCNSTEDVIPKRVISREPSAELRMDQKDTDSLPSYDLLDPILEAFIERDYSVDQITELGYERKTVGRILGLVKRNEYKRRQAPPGVRVSSRAFGRDWRYPITSGY